MTTALVSAFGLLILVLVIGGATIFGLLWALSGAGARDSISRRLHNFANLPGMLERPQYNFQGDRWTRARIQFNRIMSVFVSRRLTAQLNSANWPVATSEFALLRLVGSALLFLVGWWFTQNIFSGLGLFILAYLAPGLFLRQSIIKRRLLFERQLVDVLVLMTGAVRAGYSLLQALSVVEEEIAAPASEEISRVTREVELGRSLSDALNSMALRLENDDLQLVVTSININQQVGGNIATMLEAVTDTIRERQRLFGEIRAQTSMQRFTGLFLTLLPLIVSGLLFVINPEYMSSLFDMMCIPIGALVGIILGNIAVRQMLNFKV